ncbi:response regulator [Echinimonas agarilytica]|uniref:Response regulator n=1 Tax=Echinimonas agarilytica TaxID=1215918 RepID=A0AA42B7I3_9GAMM|nr:response regulator [Echinimonas agarilytica]MCM2679343.1 response regulator [Echinimonas agarilytica]
MLILVVEDDQILNHHLTVQLQDAGNQVHSVGTAKEALFFAEQYPIELAIVDLGLPDGDGVQLIKKFRDQNMPFPVLILTARTGWQDKVDGLNAGADDYLVKPFEMPELLARLNALARRSAGYVKAEVLCAGLTMNLLSKQVFVGETPLELTAFEYQILEYFVRHQEQVISKQRLIDTLYKDGEGDSNTIEVLISRLRKKLAAVLPEPPIHTIRGQGYRLTNP